MEDKMTPTERKRIQRARDKAAGWAEVNLRVGQEHAEALRAFAASLPPPPPRAPLRGAARADVAVLGAGYTGLTTALALAEFMKARASLTMFLCVGCDQAAA